MADATALHELEATCFHVEDGVAWIALNRPDCGNARNQKMREELCVLYGNVARSPDIKVLVLTGMGERFFCAGMDLREAQGEEPLLDRRDRLRSSRDINLLAALPIPTIAAVNGYALGGGCEMALACDLRIVADEARLGLPEVDHGLIPGGGGTQRLPRLVGAARAFELLYLGKILTGVEAVEIGLANAHIPLAGLRQEAASLAAAIAAKPARSVRSIKEIVLRGGDLPLDRAVELELDVLLMLLEARRGSRDGQPLRAARGDGKPTGSET